MQLKYGLKKEWMEFFCTKRWMALFLPAIFFVLFDPLVTMLLPVFFEMMETMSPKAGGLLEGFEATQALGISTFFSDFMQMGLLAFLLAMMKTAGGDQKNKSYVLPICNGFRRSTYILAKLIVYPAVIAVTCIAATLAVYGYSWFLFETKLEFVNIFLPMLCFVLFMVFATVLMLALGCMTGKAGISAAVIFAGITLVNQIFTLISVNSGGRYRFNRYNPLALMNYALNFDQKPDMEFWVTIAITVGITLVLGLLTVLVFKKKKHFQ